MILRSYMRAHRRYVPHMRGINALLREGGNVFANIRQLTAHWHICGGQRMAEWPEKGFSSCGLLVSHQPLALSRSGSAIHQEKNASSPLGPEQGVWRVS